MYTRSVLSLLMAIGLSACGGGSSSPEDDAGDNVEIDLDTPVVGEWYKPPVGTTWHWQLQGPINTSGFTLRAADQLRFNVFIANAAHSRELSVGLKYDLDQIDTLLPYFDFSVNEQCHQYEECDAVKAFITNGKPVLHVEYSSVYVDDSSAFQGLCQDASRQGFSTLVLPLLLDDSFRLVCP